MIKSRLRIDPYYDSDLLEECLKDGRLEGFSEICVFSFNEPDHVKECELPMKLNKGDYIDINETFFKVTEVCYEFEIQCITYTIEPEW